MRSAGNADTMTDEQAVENLGEIEHIVVLMMENRSFDHMLGYLDLLDGQDEVEGLAKATPTDHGRAIEPPYLTATAFPKSLDPPHGRKEIERQVNGGKMDGFVESFRRVNDVEDPERVAGYYTHRELPVFDFLAHNFLVCDHWFSSVPAATWANRLSALTGRCHPDREDIASGLLADLKAFPRFLADDEDPDSWRWYSWDPGTSDARSRASALGDSRGARPVIGSSSAPRGGAFALLLRGGLLGRLGFRSKRP